MNTPVASKRGGRRINAGRKPKASWLAVFFACEEKYNQKLEQQALAQYERTPRVKSIRQQQATIGQALRRHRAPTGFKQPAPERLAPKAVAKISELGRMKTIPIYKAKIGRDEIISEVAGEFALSAGAVDRHWKKGRRLKARAETEGHV